MVPESQVGDSHNLLFILAIELSIGKRQISIPWEPKTLNQF